MYGFTGATVGQLPCLAIASSTTSYGRQLLMRTKEYVETHYTMANGYPANADVVYGDTDSVMIKFGAGDVAATMPLAEKAAEEVSKIFPSPVCLEFEKIYWPYLLMNKKRYAGLLWTQAEKYDYMDCKVRSSWLRAPLPSRASLQRPGDFGVFGVRGSRRCGATTACWCGRWWTRASARFSSTATCRAPSAMPRAPSQTSFRTRCLPRRLEKPLPSRPPRAS